MEFPRSSRRESDQTGRELPEHRADLTVTNSIIQRASVGYPKRLFTSKSGGPASISARAPTERDQSRFVVQCIRELHEHGIALKEIAVLFRAGFHSFDLESELTRSNKPS